MNLLDIIPVLPSKSRTWPKPDLEKFELARAQTMGTLKHLRDLRGRGSPAAREASDVLSKASTHVFDQYNSESNDFLVDFFKAHKYLPEPAAVGVTPQGLLSSSPIELGVIDKLNSSPRASLTDLIEISKIANMIVIPMAYLNPQSYDNESYEMKHVIHNFEKSCKKVDFEAFVICPLRHYSILKHLQCSDVNLPIISNDYKMNFDVLGMMMPMMMMLCDKIQSVTDTVDSLSRRVDAMDASLQSTIRSVKQLEVNFAQSQKTIEAQALALRQSQVSAVQFQEAKSRAKAAEAAWFMAYEPLAFAVPKGTDFTVNEMAIVGPCWGPDFDEIVAAALQWKLKKGQRNQLSRKIGSLWY